MASATCGSSFLVDLSGDILAIIGRFLSHRDICNLGLCCRSLNSVAVSEKIWLTQCEMFGVVSPKDLVEWRKEVLSYKALCRFLTSVRSLLGVWVHQNPELGNVVYVMPGFVSVVGCRIIPQELGRLGIEDGPILWAPVFEVIGDDRGASMFVLHGRDKDNDYLYPGWVKSIEKTCNVLLLEVEPMKEQKKRSLVRMKSFDHVDDEPSTITMPFSTLSFKDMKKLLKIVTSQVRIQVPDSSSTPLFPRLREDEDNFQKDIGLLIERRATLIKSHRYSGECMSSSTSSENKYAHLHEFLSSGDTVGLTLHASTMDLSLYREWPHMDDSLFALYKLPIHAPTIGQEYAGLWGGTFGWPPGKPTEGKPGKALFLLVLSYYEESPGQKLLVATKILEGTHYVLHPNGSAMFIVNVNEVSNEAFPSDVGADSQLVTVKQSFYGEGIGSGYGFRYPGSKPGSLFVLQDGMLTFIWKKSQAVLTLQRLNLEDLLKKGERVPGISPIKNFSYLATSYTNVFV